ncbi:MAG: hypothetical protein IPP17_30635 [Bacteroidetes bacterium]|nr:hypothetical protein [Bacteroidota bacterium]
MDLIEKDTANDVTFVNGCNTSMRFISGYLIIFKVATANLQAYTFQSSMRKFITYFALSFRHRGVAAMIGPRSEIALQRERNPKANSQPMRPSSSSTDCAIKGVNGEKRKDKRKQPEHVCGV